MALSLGGFPVVQQSYNDAVTVARPLWRSTGIKLSHAQLRLRSKPTYDADILIHCL